MQCLESRPNQSDDFNYRHTTAFQFVFLLRLHTNTTTPRSLLFSFLFIIIKPTTHTDRNQTKKYKRTNTRLITNSAQNYKVHHFFELEALPDRFLDFVFTSFVEGTVLPASLDVCCESRLADVLEEQLPATCEPPRAGPPKDDTEKTPTSEALLRTR